MSWSISGSGKLAAVKNSVNKQFKQVKAYDQMFDAVTNEPTAEGEVLEKARILVATALRKQPKKAVVSVNASGSANGELQTVSISVSALME